jgi:F-type H+-transporting ATPase subunit epsilon
MQRLDLPDVFTQESAWSVMTDMAVAEAEIDEKAAEEAVARARKEIAEKALAGEELAFVQASLLKSLAQLHVKRRSRH